MKPLSTGSYTYTLVLLLLVLSLKPVHAQTTPSATGSPTPFHYNATDEVTLTGAVSYVLTKGDGASKESHLLLTTPSGPVDASLGRFGLRGSGAVSVAPGKQIEATGVMRLINNQQVFLVRTLRVGSEVYIIRNNHGVPLSPQARTRASQKGESL